MGGHPYRDEHPHSFLSAPPVHRGEHPSRTDPQGPAMSNASRPFPSPTAAPTTRHCDVLAAEGKERARIRGEKGTRWGGRPPHNRSLIQPGEPTRSQH